MRLSDDAFRSVVANTPLVSIDLVVQNPSQDVLLGQRLNRPAKGSWFVPGGRILKNETLDEAFARIVKAELELEYTRQDAALLGVYEHFYSDSVFGQTKADPDTHYIVIAYRFTVETERLRLLPLTQHSRFRWWSVAQILASAEVHNHVVPYASMLRTSVVLDH